MNRGREESCGRIDQGGKLLQDQMSHSQVCLCFPIGFVFIFVNVYIHRLTLRCVPAHAAMDLPAAEATEELFVPVAEDPVMAEPVVSEPVAVTATVVEEPPVMPAAFVDDSPAVPIEEPAVAAIETPPGSPGMILYI